MLKIYGKSPCQIGQCDFIVFTCLFIDYYLLVYPKIMSKYDDFRIFELSIFFNQHTKPLPEKTHFLLQFFLKLLYSS